MPSQLTYTARGDIDMLVEHPIFGVIPFTASPDDPEDYGRDLFTRAKAGEFGPIAAYVDPITPEQRKAAERHGMRVTEYQAKATLMQTVHVSGKSCYAVVEEYMASPSAPPQIKLAWATCRDYERLDDKIYLIARNVLQIPEAELETWLDNMFIQAKTVT